jgi:hypothetical protein
MIKGHHKLNIKPYWFFHRELCLFFFSRSSELQVKGYRMSGEGGEKRETGDFSPGRAEPPLPGRVPWAFDIPSCVTHWPCYCGKILEQSRNRKVHFGSDLRGQSVMAGHGSAWQQELEKTADRSQRFAFCFTSTSPGTSAPGLVLPTVRTGPPTSCCSSRNSLTAVPKGSLPRRFRSRQTGSISHHPRSLAHFL